MITVAAALPLLMSYRHRDLTYAGVIVWALIGILVRQTAFAPSVAACGLAIGAIVSGAASFHWRKPAAILEATK